MGYIGFRASGFPKSGIIFRGSHRRDYSILGFILGSPYLKGQEDLVRILVNAQNHIMAPFIPIIKLRGPPDPPWRFFLGGLRSLELGVVEGV